MAMSEGERISRLLAPGGRYLSNKQTRDAGELTLMRQAKAVPPRTTSLVTEQVQYFDYTGGDQTFTVPLGVNTMDVYLWGAGGGGGLNGAGGAGAMLQGRLGGLVPGESLTIIVGQAGDGLNRNEADRTYGGGGEGGAGDPLFNSRGGGRSAIRRGAADIVTVGAGGGGRLSAGGKGGIVFGYAPFSGGATGGSQTAGGILGGALNLGGNSTADNNGGGGSGYYGGGGGPGQDQPGAGGSSLFSNISILPGQTVIGFESTDGITAPARTNRFYRGSVGFGGVAGTGSTRGGTGGNGLVVLVWTTTASIPAEKFNTFDAQLLRKQYCVICSMPDYSANGQIATDLSGGPIKGAYVAPWAPLPNTARTTVAEQCSACLKFYFPGGAPCCASNPKYTTNYIDTFSEKYGENNPGKGPTVLSNPLP